MELRKTTPSTHISTKLFTKWDLR